MLEHSNSHPHEMVLTQIYATGAEEWHCPTCGRRILMNFHHENQNLDLLVLDPGDEQAMHTGSKGGLSIHQPVVEPVDQDPPMPKDLQNALEKLFERIDFEGPPEGADDQ
jgi:hypothetical protein